MKTTNTQNNEPKRKKINWGFGELFTSWKRGWPPLIFILLLDWLYDMFIQTGIHRLPKEYQFQVTVAFFFILAPLICNSFHRRLYPTPEDLAQLRRDGEI